MCRRVESLITLFCVKQKTAYEMRISDWSSDVCSSDLAQPAQFSKKISIELVGGLSGDDVDDAADGIFSVERSLRATQHFDTLDVEKRRVGLSRLRKIGAIQVDRHARVGCQILVRLTDPANDIFFVIYLLGIDLQAGRDLAQPLDGHDSLVAELLRFKRADGDRRVLNRTAPVFSRDDYVVDIARLLRRLRQGPVDSLSCCPRRERRPQQPNRNGITRRS